MKNISNLPRLPLGQYPTPFYKLESVSARYGRDVYIKRDDLCGVALGGNKVRKLEFLLAQAKIDGCDTVFTTGGPQSNHAALTAACAARLGMKAVLLLKRRGVTERRGNLILDELYGAEADLVDTDSYDEIYAEMRRRAAELETQGRKCCLIPLGGSTPLGAVGYVNCVREFTVQALAAGVRVGHIVSATGSGGTTAGLLLGARLFQPGAKVTGVAVSGDPFDRMVPELVKGAAALLECALAENPGDFEMVENVGAGYAVPNALDTPQILALARDEGILLDPVYTGKAYSKLCRMLEADSLSGDGAVVFVHTGGAAALFAMDLG
ncbi:putative pyridoxal-phosphate-dependent enzyme [Oscillibacter valericigenes Sjm18-20]|nr:putative pyridoxal-phosphate-dependent enzyme [Oscillibacter valericigenes Sjm18-20]